MKRCLWQHDVRFAHDVHLHANALWMVKQCFSSIMFALQTIHEASLLFMALPFHAAGFSSILNDVQALLTNACGMLLPYSGAAHKHAPYEATLNFVCRERPMCRSVPSSLILYKEETPFEEKIPPSDSATYLLYTRKSSFVNA